MTREDAIEAVWHEVETFTPFIGLVLYEVHFLGYLVDGEYSGNIPKSDVERFTFLYMILCAEGEV